MSRTERRDKQIQHSIDRTVSKVGGSRYVVDGVPIFSTGVAALQAELDKGEAAGWDLVSITPAGQTAIVLVVWDRLATTETVA